MIPQALRGTWALDKAMCGKRGVDHLDVSAHRLEFYESVGQLKSVRESSADRLFAVFLFEGEGMTWQREMELSVSGNGQTLLRRDHEQGVQGDPIRYSRC